MTEFSSATPVGAVKIVVEADLTNYRRTMQEELRRGNGAGGVGTARVAPGAGGVGPTWTPGGANFAGPFTNMAQQRGQQFVQQWPMGAPGGIANPGPPTWNPGGGGTAGGGGGGGGIWNRQPNVTMGGHGGLLSVYGIAHTAEAMTNFATAANEATKALRGAQTDAQVMSAYSRQRQVGETALQRIPLFGGLALAGRNAWDSAWGNATQTDLDISEQEEAATRSFYQGASDRSMSRRVLKARTFESSFGPGSSAFAHLETLETERRSAEKGIRDRAVEERRKYAFNVPAPYSESDAAASYAEIKNEGYSIKGGQVQGGPPEWGFQAKKVVNAMEAWKEQKNMWDLRHNYIDADANKDVAASNSSFETQKTVYKRQLQYQSDELKAREEIANLTTQQRFIQADVLSRFTDYRRAVRATTNLDDLDQLKKTSLAEARAERQGMLTNIGRSEAQEVDVTRTIVGDPRGLRHLTDPLVAIQQHIANIANGEPRLMLGRGL